MLIFLSARERRGRKNRVNLRFGELYVYKYFLLLLPMVLLLQSRGNESKRVCG